MKFMIKFRIRYRVHWALETSEQTIIIYVTLDAENLKDAILESETIVHNMLDEQVVDNFELIGTDLAM